MLLAGLWIDVFILPFCFETPLRCYIYSFTNLRRLVCVLFGKL